MVVEAISIREVTIRRATLTIVTIKEIKTINITRILLSMWLEVEVVTKEAAIEAVMLIVMIVKVKSLIPTINNKESLIIGIVLHAMKIRVEAVEEAVNMNRMISNTVKMIEI